MTAGPAEVLVLEGDVLRPARGPLVALLQVVCGWSLLRGFACWVGRLLLGARHRGRIELQAGLLKVFRRRVLLRHVVGEREETLLPGALQGWGIERSRSTFFLLLGVLFFCLGGIIGLYLLLDSLRAGFPLFGLVGLLVIGVGVTLDLASVALHELGPARSTVQLIFPGRQTLRLSGVPPLAARRLVDWLDRSRGLAAAPPGRSPGSAPHIA